MKDFLLNHLDQLISFVALAISGGLWIDTKKKKAELKSMQANAKGADADATQKIVDLYQEAIDDLEKRYKKRYEELDAFYKERLENMKKTIRQEIEKEFANELDELRGEMKSLRTNLELWKTKYRNLKAAFDDYRQKHKNKQQ